MNDPTLPPSTVADQADADQRAAALSRTPRAVPTTVPALITGGNPRDTGWWSTANTAYTEMARFESYVSARYLWYYLTLTDAYRTTIPTSIEWKIDVEWIYSGDPTATLASGSVGTGTTSVSGVVDLLTAIGQNANTQLGSFQLSIKRTGGTGDAAAVRIPQLWVLRNVAA